MTMRILRNLRISEVSSVDKAANGDAQIVLYKRDPGIGVRKEHIFGKQDYSEADDADAKDIDNGDAENETHFAEEVAGLLVRSGRFSSDQEALDFLLGSQHGAALLQRLRQSKRTTKYTRKEFRVDRTQVLKGYLKSAGGLDGLCRQIVKEGTTDIHEAELTGMITAEAKHAEPDMSEAKAFNKMFCDPSPRGVLLRQAINVAKAQAIMPVETESGSSPVEDDTQEATRQLTALAEAQIRRAPEMTRQAAWDVVVRDNPSLAERAFRRPEAKAYLQFPR
jgi:hypothetical protein